MIRPLQNITQLNTYSYTRLSGVHTLMKLYLHMQSSKHNEACNSNEVSQFVTQHSVFAKDTLMYSIVYCHPRVCNGYCNKLHVQSTTYEITCIKVDR